MDEQQAVKRLRNGDIHGLEVLVSLHEVKAVRTAYLIVHDVSLAEDIVQGAFVRAFERIHQFDPARPFAPWFLRMVANDALKAVTRGHDSLPLDDLHREPVADGTPASLFAEAETADAVWDALEKLPPRQRAVIVLRYYAGLKDAEIADELDVPPATVRWRMHAARKSLRSLLRHLLPDGEPADDSSAGLFREEVK